MYMYNYAANLMKGKRFVLNLKRLLSVLIISALIFTGTLSGIPLQSSAETVKTAYINGTNINVRSSASKKGSVIEQISNTSATVVDSVQTGSELWYKITYNNGSEQITGYIFYDDEYIKIVEYNPDASFNEKLKAFPSSYHDALKLLHSAYPNWEFVPDPVNLTFAEAVAQQCANMRKQVQVSSKSVSWRAMTSGSYDWSKKAWIQDNGAWTGASRETIAYYMDPRNFLTSGTIFQFMQQTYTSQTTENDVKEVIKGTFMEKGYTAGTGDAYGGSYAKVLIAAGKESGIDPCVLAAAIRQEQGSSGSSSLISGTYGQYKGYYNFFNVGASGKTTDLVIQNGLERAKKEGWNSIPASIIGGAKFYKNNYINRYNNAIKNQDTYYYQDFNIHNTNELWHQYAQAVHDANSKGTLLNKAYQNNSDYNLKFRIPIYADIPSNASPLPVQSTKKNNYYFSGVSVDGLTPSFNMFTYDYSLYVEGDDTVSVTPVEGATYAGNKSYSLKKGNNTVSLKVKSETGYITDYNISVQAAKACTLTININAASNTPPSTPSSPSSPSSKPTVTVKKGDTNGDGKIAIRDLANVRLHLLGISILKGNNLIGADTNGDGKITIRDLANIRLHLLGITTLK